MAKDSQVKLVRQFRGISQYKNITDVPMDHALSLLNVFISESGQLEKVRLPFATGPQPVFGSGALAKIDTFFDFQKADGTRQLVFFGAKDIGYYTATIVGGVETLPWVFHSIEDNNVDNDARFSIVDSNNCLYAANGKRVLRWDGTNVGQAGIGLFGITPPAPGLGAGIKLANIQRAANVVTFTLDQIGHVTPWPNGPIPGSYFGPVYFSSLLQTGVPVTIVGVVGDATLNGVYTLNVQLANNQGNYNQVAANSGPFPNDGVVIVPYAIQQQPPNFNNMWTINTIQRLNGTTILHMLSADPRAATGDKIVVSGLAGGNATANGTYVLSGGGGSLFTYKQDGYPDIPNNAAGAGALVAIGPTNTITGRTWRYAYGISALGVVGPASLPSPALPNNAGLIGPYRGFVYAPPSTNPLVDQVWWFANADGGGDWELVAISTITPGQTDNIILGDSKAESQLDDTQLAPLINFAPPIGDKLVKFQGRLFMSGIVADPTAIAYSAYEQYLVGGRPEEAWFPSNRLRLPIGADPVQAFGVILPGVVAFSKSNQMFMFKGQVEDITTALPVNFTAVLEELPWQTGAASSHAVQSTPYGIVWVGSDLTVKIWNGVFYGEIIGPRDLSENIYPLMRRVTPGTQSTIESAFFNFVERDWYAITLCLDGATSPNYIIFFDLAQSASDNLGTFIVQPTIPIDAIGVREDNNGGRHFILTSAGIPYELRLASEAVNGIVTNPVAPTAGMLTAYWQSGLAGSDTPQQTKMFRWGRLVTDNKAAGFGLVASVTDDEAYTLVTPLSLAVRFNPNSQKYTVNYKGRRCGFTITFPSADASVAVQSLDLRWNPAGSH